MVEMTVLAASLLTTGVVGGRLIFGIISYRYEEPTNLGQMSMPSISVCVAARNERHALAQNLELLLASKYEKMEILVLDDSSDDETSLIIKSFAHAGVRFIPGKSLPPGWLGRNHAYQTLAQEASGDYVLYLDVDTLIRPDSINKIVEYVMSNNLRMVSVLPRREDSLRLSALFGNLRHIWELIFSSKQFPVSSSAFWMIDRNILLELDKPLSTYGMSVRPEAHIAKQLIPALQYQYLIGHRVLGICYEKRWHSQREAAERLYYPMFGRSIVGILKTLTLFGLLLVPIIGIAFSLSHQNAVNLALWCIPLFVTTIWFTMYAAKLIGIPGSIIRALLWPILLIQDFIFYILSFIRYTTKSVTWKGRSIVAQPENHSHFRIDE